VDLEFVRFMERESLLSFFRMHWDYEPPWVDPFIPNELRVRFMESLESRLQPVQEVRAA